MSQATIVIDVLTAVTLRVPAPANYAAMTPIQFRDFAAQQIAKANLKDLVASIEEIQPQADQITIERPDVSGNEEVYTSPAYLSFMKLPIEDETHSAARRALEAERERAAEDALTGYDFERAGFGEFESATSWETLAHQMECSVFLVPDVNSAAKRYAFQVTFKPNSAEIQSIQVKP